MKNKNYLEKIPFANEKLVRSTDEENIVTLQIENKGAFNKIAQLILKKPKISYVHLDEVGSFVWNLSDGRNNIIKIGELVKKKYGERAEPLYERLVKYFQILEIYNLIKWK